MPRSSSSRDLSTLLQPMVYKLLMTRRPSNVVCYLKNETMWRSCYPVAPHSHFYLVSNYLYLLNTVVQSTVFSSIVSFLSRFPKIICRPEKKTHCYAADGQELLPRSHAQELAASVRPYGRRKKKRYTGQLPTHCTTDNAALGTMGELFWRLLLFVEREKRIAATALHLPPSL